MSDYLESRRVRSDYRAGEAAVPVGAVVLYEGRKFEVVGHRPPEEHPALPTGDYSLAEIYPDGVAYDLWPVTHPPTPKKFGNRDHLRWMVRRTSFWILFRPEGSNS